MAYCKLCRKVKPNNEFWQRKDRQGFYSWCIGCCNTQGRSLDYPAEEERGGGVIYPNYRSLRPEYVETD